MKPIKSYKDYELVITKANSNDFHRFVTFATGETLDDAIDHYNFWQKDGDKLRTDWTIVDIKIKGQYTNYPYSLEDAMKKAMADKIAAIHKILQSSADNQDQLDLIACIVNETPWKLSELDTACRDHFCEIMEA